MVCTMLVLFAVGAKVAVYHPQEPGTRSIACAKVWPAKQMLTEPGVATAPIVPQAAAALVMLLSLFVVVVVVPRERERIRVRARFDGLTPLAVRPPPVR